MGGPGIELLRLLDENKAIGSRLEALARRAERATAEGPALDDLAARDPAGALLEVPMKTTPGGWARRHWKLVLGGTLAVLGAILWFIFGRRATPLDRKLRKVYLDARLAEWKIKGLEAQEVRDLHDEVERRQEELGKKAVVRVEKLASTPSALVEAYRARAEHLRDIAAKRTP